MSVGEYFATMAFKDIETRRAYSRTDKVKAMNKAYIQSDRGKAVRKAYNQSGKAKAAQHKFQQSDKGKAWSKAYHASVSAKSRSRPNGYDLYIMKIPNHENWYKVGCAADPHYRAMKLSAGYPWKVEIVKVYDGCGKYEKTIHTKLKPFMVSDWNKKETEWFEISEDEPTKQIEDVLIVELFQP